MSYPYGGYVTRGYDEGTREVDAYNRSYCGSNEERAVRRYDNLVRLMAIHWHEEHKVGVRAIAKRLGIRMTEVKKLLASHSSEPEDL
jgi:hypothetical protein